METHQEGTIQLTTVDGWAQVYERPGRSQKFGFGFVGGPPVV